MFSFIFSARHAVFLVLTCCLAWSTALAAPPAAYLAEGVPIVPPTTTTTTTTTTTVPPPPPLPVVPKCPNIPGAATGSAAGYNYYSFDDQPDCIALAAAAEAAGLGGAGILTTVYCFENPWADVSRRHGVLSEVLNVEYDPLDPFFGPLAGRLIDLGSNHPETCYVCGCLRVEGCFAPGVKITMADGSLRKIEDVRAGDMVRNAKTGAPVKVSKVIEGPEALPLIRFGFDGTTVTTSQAHPVLTATGLKPANELKKGDTVFDAQGNPHAVTILETLPLEEGQRVINVNLDVPSSDAADGRLIVSDGIVTGDIVLQGLLKERKIDAR